MSDTLESLSLQIKNLESSVTSLSQQIAMLQAQSNTELVTIKCQTQTTVEQILKESIRPGGMLWSVINSR